MKGDIFHSFSLWRVRNREHGKKYPANSQRNLCPNASKKAATNRSNESRLSHIPLHVNVRTVYLLHYEAACMKNEFTMNNDE